MPTPDVCAWPPTEITALVASALLIDGLSASKIIYNFICSKIKTHTFSDLLITAASYLTKISIMSSMKYVAK